MQRLLVTAVAAALLLASVGVLGASDAQLSHQQPAEEQPVHQHSAQQQTAQHLSVQRHSAEQQPIRQQQIRQRPVQQPSAQQPPAQQPAQPDGATIRVTGSGEAAADPDRATVSVAATATGNSATSAADQLADDVSELRDALEGTDPVEAVRTVNYDLRERREDQPPRLPTEAGDREPATDGGDGRASGDGRQSADAFEARQTVAVEVDDPDAAGEVIDVAVDAGATEVRGVTFELSEQRHREVRSEAVERALADADAEAAAVANGTGLEVGQVRSVASRQGGVGPAQLSAGDAAAAGTELEARDVRVRATVEVVYEARPASAKVESGPEQ